MDNGQTQRAHWSGRLGFVLAAAGSAIGLGNIWKFPYIAGVNGGGAFVLVYLICIAAVGFPIFVAEVYIGRESQANAVSSFRLLHRPGSPWQIAGILGVFAAFLILSFYSVVGGWVLDSVYTSATNHFAASSDEEIAKYFGALISSPWTQLFWHSVFMVLTVAIVMGGLKDGIEKWSRILMPALLVLLLALLIQAMFLDGFGRAMAFLFEPDFSKLSGANILEAVGHSFFTLSLGMGAMITYGSYLEKGENLVKTSFAVAFMDTAIAILAGIVIFSVVFTYGAEPGAGPTLMFSTLPMLFTKLPGGYFISIAFFSLVVFAALTSAISLLEVVVTYFDERTGLGRHKVAIISGSVIYILGVGSAFSYNLMANVHIAYFPILDFFDKLTTNFMLPFGGILIALFFGWVLGPEHIARALGRKPDDLLVTGFTWTIRVVAPLATAIVLVNGLEDVAQEIAAKAAEAASK